MFRYDSREQYCAAIRELHNRARRSGWNVEAARKGQLAAWLGLTPNTLDTHNREHGISLDDIRTGRV